MTSHPGQDTGGIGGARRQALIDAFKPGYTWPSPVFPFRLYLDHPKCRMFIIENLTHNWDWMSRWHAGIRKTDFFFVYSGWEQVASGAYSRGARMLEVLGLDKRQFLWMANEQAEIDAFESVGIPASLINHNAWLDETGHLQIRPEEKIYDAIYVARLVDFKRHHLAAKVPNLALVAGKTHRRTDALAPPPHVYLNEKPLPGAEVAAMLNRSRVGLLLSAAEGACFSSSEYLLCGLPVVSTPSRGGRDIWYNDYNALIVDPDPDAVAAGVEHFLASPRDPHRIRQMHIDQARAHRARFVSALGDVLRRFGVTDVDPETHFRSNFIHKMRKSQNPDFPSLYG